MRRLLVRENVELLSQLAWSQALLAFDFDGTLAPIVADRGKAAMRPHTARLFALVCARYPCAVVSGRSQADVASRLGDAPVKYVVGNHGLEPGVGLADFAREIAAARSRLEDALARRPGVEIEDKRYSLAVHYRAARAKRDARAAIVAAVASLPKRMRIVAGKLVVNVVPARAPNKGEAVVHLRETERADTALYVGDDVTDEDVFALDQPGRLLSVRVGPSKTSAAKYFLRDQQEIDVLLAKLAELRAPGALP